MAVKRLIRRRVRRTRPVVRRTPSASALAARKEAKRDMYGDSGLIIGGVKDPAEKTADQMASRVMRIPAAGPVPLHQFKTCSNPDMSVRRTVEEKDERSLKAKFAPNATPLAVGAGGAPAPHSVTHAIRTMGQGRPFGRTERMFFEPRFKADLSCVRIHDGPAAHGAAKRIQARAFTIGRDIAFAKGEHRPDTDRGRRLLAHELAHVVQDPRFACPKVRRAFNACTSRTDEDSIVSSHTVANQRIEKPGDKANIAVAFSCKPRSFNSEIVDSGGTVISSQQKTIWNDQFKPDASGRWTTSWNGKRGFQQVGTFLADDGTYKHRISDLAYAPGAKGDIKAKNGGVLSESPEITISVRKNVSEGQGLSEADKGTVIAALPGNMKEVVKDLDLGASRHLVDASGRIKQKNIEDLATAVRSEAEGYSLSERQAIAWAIRNEMVRINSHEVAAARTAFNFADDKQGATDDQKLAAKVLSKNMSDDTTSDAIKWYSPKSMPPHSGKCKTDGGDRDCTGGTVSLTDGSNKSSKAPGFHNHMTFVNVPGVNQWNFRFYKL